MYLFTDLLQKVRGIGTTTAGYLASRGIQTVGDLLTLVPLRYEDRSQLFTTQQLAALSEKTVVTLAGTLKPVKTQYRGRSSIQRSTLTDETGSIKLMWFNSPYVANQIQADQPYMVSGTYDPAYKTVSQPVAEKASADTIHTNRLVPVYSSTIPLKVGSLRRVIKHITDNLAPLPPLSSALKQLHFPDAEEEVIKAREVLAKEELLMIMAHSQRLKDEWQDRKAISVVDANQPVIPSTIPFTLTSAQQKSVHEVLSDLATARPMNRLLIGDVGSGKTVVAAIAAWHAAKLGFSTALVAPTKILANQHVQTITRLLPDLSIQLITGQSRVSAAQLREDQSQNPGRGKLYIGTHAVLHKLEALSPQILIFDEQQRFGVVHRSVTAEETSEKSSATIANTTASQPHILTMTATPIPRSLTLTLFAHLDVSVIDELPPGRIPTKTWLVPAPKRAASYEWIESEVLQHNSQVFVVCPFIDPSSAVALENVASTTIHYEAIKAAFPKRRVAHLHGRLKKAEQSAVIAAVYAHEVDILVTTPIVEVGVDLPEAAILIIENAERFGLSSLHQLRGRVGRAGQQGYCLLFTDSHTPTAINRLKLFSNESNGLKIAEIDLQHRGSGDLFGTAQSGFGELKFGNWANLELIAQARNDFSKLPPGWKSSLLKPPSEKSILGN